MLNFIPFTYKKAAVAGRYLTYDNWFNALKTLSGLHRSTAGFSVEGRPIEVFTLGKGPTNVLIWSQMHGNESTATKALADLFLFLNDSGQDLAKQIFAHCTLTIVPVLNPDGAVAYTRVNSNQVDLNRDAQALSQPESRVLNQLFKDVEPHWCFNLHDQRTIFSAGDQPVSATVSFLSPAADEQRSTTPARKSAMQLIAFLNTLLQNRIPNGVGRYSDAFNLNCVGDTFQSQGVPTLLFEAGHYPMDYARETTRELIFLSLVHALKAISDGSYALFSIKDYLAIPENKELFCDLLLRQVTTDDGKTYDVEIQYKEVLEGVEIRLVPVFKNILPHSEAFAHQSLIVQENISFSATELLKLIGHEVPNEFYNCVKISNAPIFC